jgi:hypothetical protein
MDTSSDNDQPTKPERPRLNEIMPAARSAGPSRDTSLIRGEATWFEPATHPGMNGFWSFPK